MWNVAWRKCRPSRSTDSSIRRKVPGEKIIAYETHVGSISQRLTSMMLAMSFFGRCFVDNGMHIRLVRTAIVSVCQFHGCGFESGALPRFERKLNGLAQNIFFSIRQRDGTHWRQPSPFTLATHRRYFIDPQPYPWATIEPPPTAIAAVAILLLFASFTLWLKNRLNRFTTWISGLCARESILWTGIRRIRH